MFRNITRKKGKEISYAEFDENKGEEKERIFIDLLLLLCLEKKKKEKILILRHGSRIGIRGGTSNERTCRLRRGLFLLRHSLGRVVGGANVVALLIEVSVGEHEKADEVAEGLELEQVHGFVGVVSGGEDALTSGVVADVAIQCVEEAVEELGDSAFSDVASSLQDVVLVGHNRFCVVEEQLHDVVSGGWFMFGVAEMVYERVDFIGGSSCEGVDDVGVDGETWCTGLADWRLGIPEEEDLSAACCTSGEGPVFGGD